MCKVEQLRALLNARLSAAVEEIFVEFQKTIAEYEEELGRTKEENERQRQQLAAVSMHGVDSHITDDSDQYPPSEQQDDQSRMYPAISPKAAGIDRSSSGTLARRSSIKDEWKDEQQKWIFGLEQEKPEAPHVKGEEDADSNRPLSGVLVKTEDKEDYALTLQLRLSPSEENRWAEPPCGSSSQHTAAEDDGDHSRGSQAYSLSAPLSLHTVDDTNHMTRRNDDIRWKCFQCGETFGAKKNLNRHLLLHTRDQTLSFSGNKTAPTKQYLKTGTRAKPRSSFSARSASISGKKPVKCSVCGQTFSLKQNMVAHMRIHTGEKPFACSECGVRFTQKITLIHHIRTHTGERPFSCSVCKKSFNHPSSMLRHIRTHAKEKPFPCPHCGKGFADKSTLRNHMWMH